ncbi:lipid II flippase Amj family protein [Paenibacillus sp. GSMTC-2017]|uniref:lipid II flippase Amj family protein n=1 Tax=Paenibacillus sp. GSMTC-2017 TaxID=2794350 RepID=UPI0018D7BCC0|nr:lipid II flippase Amj family protein [Paenibacillus sp. GSMTC-2017]MBH5320281.1 lipid II flippase Amj family protein [Paenibacillus sp. GSMTC-2017]
MFEQVILVAMFTFIIHLSETLTYSLRLAGVRLGKLAVALSLSGIILLISRTTNMVQAPLTGKMIDFSKHQLDYNLIDQFRIIIGAATMGTLVALLLFPSAVLLSSRVISHLEVAGSIPQLVRSSVSIQKITNIRYHLRFPKLSILSRLRTGGIPKRLVVLNCLVTTIYTIGVLAALLASTLTTEYSIAASQSSGLINGIATILLTILIDPQIGLITDKVLRGEKEIATLNKIFGVLMMSRLLGTVLAQVLLVPAAYWIKWLVSVL